MKSKTILTLALSGLLLTACGGATSSPEPSSAPKTTSAEPTTSSSTPVDDSSYSYVSVDSDSGIGTRTNDEEYDYESIKVNKPAKALVDDFAFGADLSIVAEVEHNGGVFYNEKGEEQDVFKLLAADGVNYCRLRLWNDPKSAVTGESYGGGGNDLETDIALAKRAKAAGMKVLLDFHYSDSWADPQKFHCPKAWADELSMDKPDLIADFTRDSLNAFKKAGIYVDSCQIGNETNYGIAGEKFLGGAETIVAMVRSGVAAAKEVFPNIKTLVHLTNIKSPKGVYNFLDAMEKGLDGENTPVPYDIVGLSYYPFWHGTQDNLLNVMNHIRDTYNRPTWVVETSYGFTDEPNENCSNTYHSSTFETPGGYITSIQGQTTELADVVSTISSVKDNYGQGVFYWEPAWLPVAGSTWASKAGQFYNDHGRDGTAEQIAGYSDASCRPAWSNQAWFSYTGKALPSASTYKHIIKGDKTAKEHVIGLRTPEVDVNVNLVSGKITLPGDALIVTDFDALRRSKVSWTQSEIDAILASGDGDYDVHGKVDGKYDIVAHVKAETNYVKDYSFEEQKDGEQVALSGDNWQLECSIDNAARIEAKSEGNLDGEKYFHWFNNSDFYFTLSQTLTGVRAGSYDLSTYIMAGDLPSDYSKFDLWYQIGEQEKVVVDILNTVVKGWGAPLKRYMNRAAIENIEIPEVSGGANVTIGITAEVGGTGWGHCDLWSFAAHKEYVPEEEYVSDGVLADGNFAAQTLWAEPSDPWVTTENNGAGFQVADTTSGDSITGTSNDRFVKWWSEAAYSFAFHQNVKNLEAGQYTLSFVIVSDVAASYESFSVYYKNASDESETVLDMSSFLQGWKAEGVAASATINVKGTEKIEIGFRLAGKANSWGRMTDIELAKIPA